jgi:hypothetical protein
MRKTVELLGGKDWVSQIKVKDKLIKLPTETYNYVVYDDKLIVYICSSDIQKDYPNENPGRNIWCYDLDGNVIWKIEKSPYYLERVRRKEPNILKSAHYYGGIYYDPHTDEIRAFADSGYYIVDPKNGKVSNYVFTRD